MLVTKMEILHESITASKGIGIGSYANIGILLSEDNGSFEFFIKENGNEIELKRIICYKHNQEQTNMTLRTENGCYKLFGEELVQKITSDFSGLIPCSS